MVSTRNILVKSGTQKRKFLVVCRKDNVLGNQCNNFTAFTFSLRNISVRQTPINITFKDEVANNMPLKQVFGNIISDRHLTYM